MMAQIVAKRLLKTRDWAITLLLVPAGEIYKTHRNLEISDGVRSQLLIPGRILNVPQDPEDLIKFKSRFSFSPFTGPAPTQVFIPNNVTVVAMKKGTFEYTYRAPDRSWQSPTTEYPGSALPIMVATGANDFQKNIKESKSYCCSPTESAILWDRNIFSMDPTQEFTIPVRSAARHKLLLCEGSITINGVEHPGPAVIDITTGDKIVATSIAYCAEVWVDPTE